MDVVLQTNIFFYITSIAVILVTALIIFILWYVISILRNVKDISDTAKKGTDMLAEDLVELRKNVKKDGVKARHILRFFLQSIVPKRRKAKRAKTKKEDLT